MFKNLIILSLLATMTLSSTFMQPKKVDPKEALDLVQGYLEGTGLFKDVAPCEVEDEQAAADLNDIIEKIKGIHGIADVLPALEKIIPDSIDLFHRISEDAKQCEDTYLQVKDIIAKVLAYMKRPEYIQEFAYHTIGNISEVMSKINDLKDNWGTRTARENGVKMGEMERFIFYWDFKLAAEETD